ncbi:MAG: flagellar hook-length control protein FliK [Marinomonas foliarum]|uniref:Flagellar hook-length control protein FliK n=1 Tax=Marinomonas foliarum TaxID=491950 RepID=A0A369AKZ0_9GAMM|nr:flagellar hook-length control protein FliK [Marinomonas foliarum]RCX08837.1 flagellar hook-length control protein FliK [Marinomonas foliarum]
MRTDSNSVLSLSSNVPPKKPISTKAPSKSGDAFANDFNKAKDTLASDKASSRGNSSTSTQSSVPEAQASRADKAATTKEPKKDLTPIKDRSSDGEAGLSNQAVASKDNDIKADGSGKKLQGEGEATPIQGLSGAISVDEETPVSTLSTTNTINSDAKLAAVEAEPLKNINGGLNSNEALTTDAMPQAASVMKSEQSVDAINTSGDAATDGENIVGVLGLTPAVVGEEGLTAKSNLVEPSGEMVDPDLEGGESSLSWVLSQMANPVTKAASDSVTGEAEIDPSKVVSGAAAAAVVGSVVNKESRSGAVPQSLLGAGTATALDGDAVDLSDTLLADDGVLLNEPIELRKKEQEAMIGRMSAQIDGSFADDNSSGGLNSSLHNNNVNRAAVVAANSPAMTPQNNLTMSLPPGHPGWANEMTQKVAWIARDGGHTAHIRLDPPELGSLTVKVSVDSDSNTQISFIAATPQARDLLEGQMGRLRDMLAQQGMDLSRADVDVSQQDTSGAQDRANDGGNGSSQGLLASNDELEDELDPSNLSYVSASGVDYYA